MKKMIVGLGILVLCLGLASASLAAEKFVDVDFFETDIRSAFEDLAAQAEVTILVDDYVEGSITLSLQQVSLDEIIKTMCMKGSYDYKKLKDDLFIVGSVDPDSPTFQKHAVTRKVELNYADSKNVIVLLKHYKAYISSVGRTIIIRAWPKLADKILEDIKTLDKSPKQVQGKVVIAELTEEARAELGLDTLKSGSFTSEPGEVGLTLEDTYKFMMTLKALERKGEASLRASTTLTVPEGKEATISLGKEMRIVIETEEEYYRIEKVRAETSLTLGIERVTSNNEIIFKYKVMAGDIAEEVPKVTEIPIVYDRSAEGTAIVPNNTAFVIGGLTREMKRAIYGSIPPSKTKIKEKTDLLVVVLPHIIGTVMPEPEILEKELEKVTIKPEVKKEFKPGVSINANYFWPKVNDFVEGKGYSGFDPMISCEGELNLTPHFALFGSAGKSEKQGNSLNIASYGLLWKTGIVFENPRFFIGVGTANGKLNLSADEYTLNSYMLKSGLGWKLGMLELGGGYQYFPKEWKKNGVIEKDIDSSGAYGYVGLCLELR